MNLGSAMQYLRQSGKKQGGLCVMFDTQNHAPGGLLTTPGRAG